MQRAISSRDFINYLFESGESIEFINTVDYYLHNSSPLVDSEYYQKYQDLLSRYICEPYSTLNAKVKWVPTKGLFPPHSYFIAYITIIYRDRHHFLLDKLKNLNVMKDFT